jgi:hypothetical protein
MGFKLQSLSAAAFVSVALISHAFASQSAANQIDAASDVRGSLGASADDLIFSSGGGASVFFLNAGCALLFVIAIVMARRMDTRRRASRMPFRATSNFAR